MLATKLRSKRIGFRHGMKPAGLGVFAVNGNTDQIKILANTEGLRALRSELEEAEKSIRNNQVYEFGDPLWLRGNSRLVSVEPAYMKNMDTHLRVSDEDIHPVPDIGPRIFMGTVIMSILALTVIGLITIVNWIF